jgi:integrase
VSGITANPTAGLSTAHEANRQRFLTGVETQHLIAAIDEDANQVAAQAIKLLLLTGARRNEITHARWEHIDWQRHTLLVPLSKSGKPRTIALSTAAEALLRSLQRGSEHVFPSPVTGHPFASLFYP